MTFAGGGDTQYKVEVAVNSESDIIYSGWLSLSDLGQTFQPDPNVLQLTAICNAAWTAEVVAAYQAEQARIAAEQEAQRLAAEAAQAAAAEAANTPD